MEYERLTVYFMSGTGNSYRAACWMAEEAEKAGLSVEVVPIAAADPKEEVEPSPCQLVGFVMPTHGFTAPWQMIHFALRLPRTRSTSAFVFPTRAGGKIGPVFTPGIAGSAAFIIAIILALKGFSLRGIMSLDMPSNWMSLHSGYKPHTVKAINDRSQPVVAEFMGRILSGRLNWFTVNNLYELLWGVLLFPVSLGYLLVGRFILAKTFFVNAKCTGCGLCVENCPVGALKLRGEKKPIPFWSYNCESCMRCMAFCPEKAIECCQPWAVMLCFLVFLPFSLYLFRWLESLVPGMALLNNGLMRLVVNLICIYALIFLSYRLLHYFSRIPFFNSILTYSTLTHIYRCHRQPGVEPTELKQKVRERDVKMQP